ncbi:coiled-coil and C2 domain-containing protein 1-like isoform X1 [Danaus plexippus]|nr:coiled-coil and C2 domain-containing protein 1-like isoform X1 [Danaus plexippus]
MYKKPTSGKKTNLSQFGLIDIPDLDDEEAMDLSDDDVDLEAELAALSGGKKQQRQRKPAPVPASDLDAMIAASLKDIPSDEDVSGDEDDPDLLDELQALAIDDQPQLEPPRSRTSRPAPPPPSAENSIVSLLQERISNYAIAEKNAKESGESGRARRFGRALKTLNDLLKQAKSGKSINDEDIPPPVSVGKPKPDVPREMPSNDPQPEPTNTLPEPLTPTQVPLPPPRTTSIPPNPEEPRSPTPPEPKEPPPLLSDVDPARAQGLQLILNRKAEFKAAALSSKHSGDKTLALEYLKVVKQFDIVVEAYKSGQEMDLSELPTPEGIAAAVKGQKEEEQVQNAAEPDPEVPPEPAGLITASSVDEALRQRLAHFQEQESKAKDEGNTSKARRMGRIVKQYQDAIKMHKAGRPIPTDELPTPNGYAPIPTGESPSPRPAPSASPRRPAPTSVPSPSPSPSPSRAPSRYDKQIALLLHKQKQFKEAALQAKKDGNIEQAKEYLRAAKGFDSVLEAARGGLAVDLASLPPSPGEQKTLEDTFDIVTVEECVSVGDITSEDTDVMAALQRQLTKQMKMCLTNKEHYRAMGNVAESNRYHHLAATTKQDLDMVIVARSLSQGPPKFHYENRKFSIVQCNTDLNETDLELTIVRGITYNVANPKDVDTYVKFEFPFPQDAPVSDRTQLIKDTNNPQYDAVFSIPIQRSSRACLRVFKRHAIKFEVYSRGCSLCCSGWFRSDTLVGSVSVKLAPLESVTTLHDSYPLMEGRRPAGGSLEVKLRVRTPLLQQQFEHTTVRWLIIDP